MQFMPGDNSLVGPLTGDGSMDVMSALLVQDWLKEDVDPKQLIVEAEELLTAVDLAISGANLEGDPDCEQMKRSWAFIGPNLYRDIQRLKSSTLRKQYLLSRIAVITMTLTTRRRTLEINNIKVLKTVQGS